MYVPSNFSYSSDKLHFKPLHSFHLRNVVMKVDYTRTAKITLFLENITWTSSGKRGWQLYLTTSVVVYTQCGRRKFKTFREIRFRGGQLFSSLLTELCSKSSELLMCVGSPLQIKFGLVGFAFRMSHFVTPRQIPRYNFKLL